MRKGHDSSSLPKARNNPDHKKRESRNKTIGGSRMNVGFGNSPTGK